MELLDPIQSTSRFFEFSKVLFCIVLTADTLVPTASFASSLRAPKMPMVLLFKPSLLVSRAFAYFSLRVNLVRVDTPRRPVSKT